MCAWLRTTFGALALVVSLISCWGTPGLAGDAKVARGRALFEKRWDATRQFAPAADGLGPLFNERSCAACHLLGGIGGAGPVEKNIDLLTPTAPIGDLFPGDIAARLKTVHPAFAEAST